MSALALEGITLELLAAASRTPAASGERLPAPRWLRRVRDLLHDSPGTPLRFSDLARKAGVSPTHLARAFRRHFGATPGEYLRRLRVEEAARAIEHGERSLARIAADCGFVDQSHLGRAFRKEKGTTPARYRSERIG